MNRHNLVETNKAYFDGRFLQCEKCTVFVYKNKDDLINFIKQDISGPSKYSSIKYKFKREHYNCRALFKNNVYIFHPKTGKREAFDYCPMSNNDFIAKSIIE